MCIPSPAAPSHYVGIVTIAGLLIAGVTNAGVQPLQEARRSGLPAVDDAEEEE